MAGPRLVLLVLAVLAVVLVSAGASSVLPAARPGLLARTAALLGWGSPDRSQSGPPPSENTTAVVERFQRRLRSSVTERLRAAELVHLSTTRRQHRRAKRSSPETLKALSSDDGGVNVLKDNGAVKAWEIPAPGAQHVHMFEDNNRTYALAAFGQALSNSWLYELRSGVWMPLSNVSSYGAVQFTSFEHGAGRFVIGAEYNCTYNRANKRGSILYQFREGRLELQHVLPAVFPTDVTVWSDYDTTHIGVTSEHEETSNGAANYHVNSSIFKWSDGNFKQYTLPTYGARDFEHFRMHSHSFLAVANHQNNDGSLNVHSEILRYNLETEEYQPFQRLLTRGAVRIRHFSWGRGVQAEHFLVVANQADRDAAGEETQYRVSSVIYKFSRSQFVPFQCIPTVRARDVLPVWGPSETLVLALLDDEGLHLYQYTGWRFVRVARLPLPTAAAGAAHSRLSTFTHGGHSLLTVGSVDGRHGRPLVYRLEFERRRDLYQLHSRCSAWCDQLHTSLADLDRKADILRTGLLKAPRVDQPITFSSLRVHSANHSHFNRLTVDNVRLRESVTLNSGLVARLKSLRRRLQHGLTTLDGLQESLPAIISIANNHTFTQTVTVTGAWRVDTASAGRLQLQRLNALGDVTGFLSGLVRTDRAFTDRSARLAFGTLRLNAAARLTAGTLSHTRPSSFVTLSGDHEIRASKVLDGRVTAANMTAGPVNGVRLTASTVLAHGRLPVGVTRFSALTVSSDLRVRRMNDIVIESVLLQAVSVGAGRLPVSVTYAGPVYIQSATVRSINGVSAERLLQRALTVIGGQNITGGWSVGRLRVAGELAVSGTLNTVRVPDDLVLVSRPELSYYIASLAFSSVTVHQLTVQQRLGPVRVIDDMPQLLLTSGDQLVVSRKTTGSLHLASASTVTGLINGVNVSTELLETALNQTADRIDADKAILGDILFVSDLRLAGHLNRVDAAGLLRSALKLTHTNLPSMVFDQLQISGDLRASHLNGVSPSEWVMSGGTDQIITGDKALLSLWTADMTLDMLNGLQLDDLYGSVLRTEGDQHVQGPLLLAAETLFDTLLANSVSWEGYNLTEAVTVGGSHVIRGTKLYSAPLQVADLQVTDLWVNGLVDRVNITSLLSRSAAAVNTTYLKVSGYQKFSSQVTASALVVTGSVNGGDLLTALQHAVLDSLVRGDLTFDAPVTVDRLAFSGSFDGVSAAEFGSDWLSSAGGQTVSGPLQFTSGAPLTVPALVVGLAGRLNGVLGGKLLDGRVPLTPGTVISQNVTVQSLVAADVTIQMEGVDLADAVRQNQSQLVLGAKVFAGGMYALNRIAAEGVVNGVHLDSLCERVVLKDATNTFGRLTVNGDVILHRVSSPLSWTVDGVPLDRLEQLFWLRDVSQTLTGHVSLARPYLTSMEHVQSLLSGPSAVAVDLAPYLRDHWSRSRPQTVTGAVTFLSDVAVARLTADRLTVSGALNARPLATLPDSVLTVSGGTVTGEWVLPELFVTDRLSFTSLGGVSASALLRTSDTAAHFTTHRTVHHLAVSGELVLPEGGLVYLLDLSEELDLAGLLTDRPVPVVVNSDVVFGGETVTFSQPLTVYGTVNGVRLLRSAVLTLAGRQRVPGVTRLTHVGGRCLQLPDLTAPVVNGVDLGRLIHHAVRASGRAAQSDGALVVTGYWNFTRDPSILGHPPSRSGSDQQTAQLLRRSLGVLQQLRGLDRPTDADGQHLAVVRDIYRALQEVRARLRVASYLQYYAALQRWRSDIIRLQPVFLAGEEGGAPAFLAAIWETRVQLLRWRPTASAGSGRWLDGPRYPERRVACMSGLTLSDGTAYVAEARLVQPPAGAELPARVYRWDDPALGGLGEAVNYIFLYHRDVLTQSQAMPSHKTVDVKSLKPSPAHDCFLFVHFAGNASHLVCHSGVLRSFVVHQAIPTLRAREAAVYRSSGSVCVAVAGGQRVDLWCWDDQQARLSLRQTISAAAVGVATAEFQGRTLLAVIRAESVSSAGLVDVYRLESDGAQFVHVQTVPVWAVRSARLLVLPSEELLMACLTADGRVVYLQYRGPSGFEPRGQLSVGHAATMELFNMDGLATQLTVAGRPPADMFALTEHYPAAAFTGKFMGNEW